MEQNNVSELHKERLKFKPVLPAVLKKGVANVKPVLGKATKSVADFNKIKAIFEKTYGMPVVSFKAGKNSIVTKKTVKVGVVLSGGQAPGGHNVIFGLLEGLKSANKKNKLLGFLGGPSGILDNKTMEITDKVIANYKNTGGFDMIQSGRTKIETPEQFAQAKETILKNKIDA
jgi:pyrophosphate--fructose-6-phosphate 1-phosphotransferase